MEPQNDPSVKEVDLNRSQALIHLINANVTYALWPRAGGKTSGGIGPRVERLSEVMPRSQTLLVADSFERISKVLLPSIENFLTEEMGLRPDIDYVVHKRPPAHWVKPLFVPAKYDHVVSFATGYALCEVSLEVSGSGNGYNAQSVIADEVKYFDEKKFKSEVRPAIRGGKKTKVTLPDGTKGTWGDLPEFQSMWFFTDKFPSKGANIGWVLNKKAQANDNIAEIVYTLQLEVIKLQLHLDDKISDSTKYRTDKLIAQYEETLRKLRMDLVYYSDALPYENIDNLGEKYFKDLERDLPKYEYKVAIENKDPDTAIVPFYPDLSGEHYYDGDIDCNPNKSLIIASDYQYSIAPVCVAQFDQLEDSVYTSLNFVKSLHSLHPQGLADAIDLFCREFKDHPDRHVYYIYDQTAIGRSPHGKTFKDIVVDTLDKNGWTCTEIYTGDPPDHDIKHERFKQLLTCRTDNAIRVNKRTNPFLKKSLEKASAITVNGKTKKDKSSEKEGSPVPPEEATHYSDVFDQIVWAAIEMEMVPQGDDAGMDIKLGTSR
jgi:hypothetical protein